MRTRLLPLCARVFLCVRVVCGRLRVRACVSLSLSVCVCVRARARVRVCVCALRLALVVWRGYCRRYLDLSDNKLEHIPVQLRRLINLRTLLLSNNKLDNSKLRQVTELVQLRRLELRNTGRSTENIPMELPFRLINLTDLDLGDNNLATLPAPLYALKTVRRLRLDGNALTKLNAEAIAGWESLESLNLSRNTLTELPVSGAARTTHLHMAPAPPVTLPRQHLLGWLKVFWLLPLRRIPVCRFPSMLHVAMFIATCRCLACCVLAISLTAFYVVFFACVPPSPRNVRVQETIEKLTKLRKLYANNNKLERLPSGITRLQSLVCTS